MRYTYQVTACANSQSEVSTHPGGFYEFNTGNGTDKDSGRLNPKKTTRIPGASVLLIEKRCLSSGIPSDANYAKNTAFEVRGLQEIDFEYKFLPYGRHNGHKANYLSFDGRVQSLISPPMAGSRAVFNAETWVLEN